MPGKCVFNPLWTAKDDYIGWIEACYDRHKAKCKLCYKEVDVSNMGEAALKKHMKGAKHVALMKAKTQAATSLRDYCFSKTPVSRPSTSAGLSNGTPAATNPSNLLGVTRKEVLDAEILWTFKCIASHYSYKSCNGIGDLFQRMFPDSVIARQISGSERKYAYLCHFGLAPFIHSFLYKQLGEIQYFTLLFDESLNKSLQKKQLDIHVRFWNSEENLVKTHYLTSSFIGHGRASDLLQVFQDSLAKLNLSKVIQISMDGPAVNLKFYDDFQRDLKKEHKVECLSIGTCGLHILNNAFKKGASSTEWDISSILTSLHFLFNDSPARRDDFLSSSELNKMPLKFCNHRWLENAPVSARAYEIWGDVVNYIKLVEKGKFSKIGSKSFTTLASASKDVLLRVKLLFFTAVSEVLKPLMEFYQSDKPLLPFLPNDVLKLVKHCLTLFNVLKKEAVEKIDSIKVLSDFDFDEKSNYSPIEKVSAGFRADKLLKELIGKKEVSEASAKTFKYECQKFVLTMITKLMSNCPINYSFVRNLVFLDPKYILKNKQNSTSKFKHIVSSLSKINHISDENCDAILLEFGDFLDSVCSASEEFEKFDSKSMRLDTFYSNFFEGGKYIKLWNVFKMLFILSHGQASVERGFSVNKTLEVENLKEDSYISQRLVHEFVKNAGGVSKIIIQNELRISASAARSKYHEYLEQQREMQEKLNLDKKRKLQDSEVTQLKSKKAKLEKAMKENEDLANSLSEKAESKNDLSMLKKSNQLRRENKKLIDEVSDIEKKITEIRKEF